MAVWFILLALGFRYASSTRSLQTGKPASNASKKKQSLKQAARENALSSPWLQGATEAQYEGHQVKWLGILGENITGMNGHPSRLEFTKLQPEGGNATEGDSFSAVLKAQDFDTKHYAPEIEMTQIASATNGFSLGFIQGAHRLRTSVANVVRMSMLSEFIRGKDLFEVWQEPSELVWDDYMTRMIIAQLIFTLKKLEEQRITHRDIKRENFMLTPADCEGALLEENGRDGRRMWREMGCRIVLIDYGLGCTYSKELVQYYRRNLGCSKTTKGTVGYIPPEAVSTLGFGSVRGDVFATGVLIYYLIHGELPQDRVLRRIGSTRSDNDVLRATKTRDLDKDLAGRLRRVPAGVQQALLAMLGKDPAKRPSAAKLWDMSWLDWESDHGKAFDDEELDKDHYRNWVEQLSTNELAAREKAKEKRGWPAVVATSTEEMLDAKYSKSETRILADLAAWNAKNDEVMFEDEEEESECGDCVRGIWKQLVG